MNIDYIRAVNALPDASWDCPCGTARVPFQFLAVDSAAHWACPDCEAASWHVDHHGRHHGPLRQVFDPAWSWVPHTQRAAVARFGMLGASKVASGATPILRFDAFDDAVWVADRAMLVRLDIEAQYLRRLAMGASRVLANAVVADGLARSIVSRAGHRMLDVTELAKLTVYEPQLPLAALVLVTELYPDVIWWWLSATDPVLAFVGDKPVAAVMPNAAVQKVRDAA